MCTGSIPNMPVSNASIQTLGTQLWQDMQREVPGIFNKNYGRGKLIDWAMQDEATMVALFRLVDVLPALRNLTTIVQHTRAYLLPEQAVLPRLMSTALRLGTSKPFQPLAAHIITKQVIGLARHFIAGSTPALALPSLRELHHQGIGFTMDLLGETTLSCEEALRYRNAYLDLIETLVTATSGWPHQELIDASARGSIPRTNVSVKLSALHPFLDALDVEGSVKRVSKALLPILLKAKECGAFVNLDMETWAYHEITFRTIEQVLTTPDLREWPDFGVAIQAYTTHARHETERLLDLAKARGVPITVRLVKGAYWDYEVVHARQHGFNCPVFLEKEQTDANFEMLSIFLLDNIQHLLPAFGSHNLRSLCHAIVQARQRNIPPNGYEIQMLFGMAEPELRTLRNHGQRMRVYTPVGEMIPGMAYLVRRLLENVSNQGFLRRAYGGKMDMKTMFAPPNPTRTSGPDHTQSPKDSDLFRNCEEADFNDSDVRNRFAKAVQSIVASFPHRVPVTLCGNERWVGRNLKRVCPSEPSLQISTVTLATEDEADRAVEAAAAAWPDWRDRPLDERATLLESLADRLESDRFDLAALEMHEVAKPWRDADADVAEAIDFCRYYARQARTELAPRKASEYPGEENWLLYEGRGPAVIIAPWNFPLAILCGMTTAALVAGNTAIMKPAEQSSATGYALFQRMLGAGFPPQVIHFLPGTGETVGQRLVAHPLTAMVAFTGSNEVGLSIIQQAAVTRPAQPQVKRVVCEMGGKNAIIIDDDADLDEAVAGVVAASFGYAGQKCSACSRVLIVEGVYEVFVNRLIEACKSLEIAPAHAAHCQLGPVIDAQAYERLVRRLADPEPGAALLYQGESLEGGYYVPPSIFNVQDPFHPFMQDELFGPILSVMRCRDFSDAIDVALSTRFALTGGVYSRNPDHLNLARTSMRVGNLYLNRSCTGAKVGRQPFGGFNMSGGGTKAGGPGYLLNFVDLRCVTENTMRHGFTPETHAFQQKR